MARRYTIQHRTTKVYLGFVPSLIQDPASRGFEHLHVKEVEEAATYSTDYGAEIERRGLGSFANSYKVTPVEVVDMLSPPREIPFPEAVDHPEDPKYSGPVY